MGMKKNQKCQLIRDEVVDPGDTDQDQQNKQLLEVLE